MQIMVNFHLAPYPRPDASFVNDGPREQRHKAGRYALNALHQELTLRTPHLVAVSLAALHQHCCSLVCTTSDKQI